MLVSIVVVISVLLALVTIESISWSIIMYQHGRWLQKNPSYERRVAIDPKIIIKAAVMTGALSLATWSWFSHMTALSMFHSSPLGYKFYGCFFLAFGIHTSHVNLWAMMSRYICLPEIFWPCFSQFRKKLGLSLLEKGGMDRYCLALAKWSELAETSESHRSLLVNFLDVIPQPVWAKDSENRFTYVNDALLDQLLLLNRSDIIGKTSSEIAQLLREEGVSYTFGELCCDSDELTKSADKPSTFFEYGLVDGKYLALRVLKAPIYAPDGDIIGTIGAGQNVTWLLEKWKRIEGLYEDGNIIEVMAEIKTLQKEYEGFRDIESLIPSSKRVEQKRETSRSKGMK